MRPKAEWAIDSKAMQTRGIIVLVLVGQKSNETKHLSQVKLHFNPFFTAKVLQIWRALFASSGL